MYIKNIFSILVLLITLQSFSQEQYYNSFSIDSDLMKNANAVVRLNDLNVIVESQDRMTITYNTIVSILNEKGNKNFHAAVGYDGFNKVKKIEAVIYDENGKVIKKIKKRDFIDHSAVDGGTLYSDSRFLYMPYTPTIYPYTVHFNYEIESQNTGAIPSWKPITGYYIGIENASFSVIDNANIGIHFKEKNLDDFEIESNNSSDTIKYSIKNFKGIKPEDLSPSLSSITPKVMIRSDKFSFYGVEGKATNWVEFGDWMIDSLLKDRNKITEETKTEILELVSSTDDLLQKAKLVYEYVQKNTRYISVQVGIGGVQPIPALEVDELKYGDCKGLTNYTAALLEVAGIPSYYTVVEAGNEIINFEDDFPSIEQGNHIILGIPNDDNIVWIDCTSQLHPFGFIGDFTDNRKVLTIAKGNSKIVETTKYVNADNHQLIKSKISLQKDGGISANLTIETKGTQYDNRFPLQRQSDKDIKDYYKNIWGELNYLEIKDYKFDNNKEDVNFIEALELKAHSYASLTDKKLIFQPNIFNKNTFVPRRYKNRQYSLKIQRGYMDEDESVITIPEDFVVEFIPEDISISNEFGDYIVSYKLDGNSIIFYRRLLVKNGTYPKTKYKDYRDFRRKISKSDKLKIILNRIK